MEQYAQRHGIGWLGVVVAIFIVFILGFIFFPICMCPHREKARQVNCISNQRKIAQAVQLYAQEHGAILPGALSWSDGKITSSYIKWATDLALPPKILSCKDSTADIAYGMPVALPGNRLDMLPTGNAPDIMLTADATCFDTTKSDALFFSRADIATTLHGNSPTSGFVASFLDGHVAFIVSSIAMSDAVDATSAPAAAHGSDILYQGADHLFLIDGKARKVTGKSFLGLATGRTAYFSCYYASLPANGQGMIINAPGGTVTLATPTQGKYYTIFVRPSDVKHKIAAILNGTTLTIINNAV